MNTVLNFRILSMLSMLLFTSILTQAQTDKKSAELKNLETGIAAAKAKVTLNERKMTVADSLIESGNQLIAESKTEIKTINAESNKLDKDHAIKQKPLIKLSTSKDKGESSKARADLKTLDVKYRSDVKALDTRLREAERKQTIGNANLTKGKAAKKSAQNALKASQATLKTARAKYDAAYASGENTNLKENKKK